MTIKKKVAPGHCSTGALIDTQQSLCSKRFLHAIMAGTQNIHTINQRALRRVTLHWFDQQRGKMKHCIAHTALFSCSRGIKKKKKGPVLLIRAAQEGLPNRPKSHTGALGFLMHPMPLGGTSRTLHFYSAVKLAIKLCIVHNC